MKRFLFVLLFAFILCFPNQEEHTKFMEERRERRKKRHEQIVKWITEKGSEALKNLIKDVEGVKIWPTIRMNKDKLKEEDLNLFRECRHQAIFEMRKEKDADREKMHEQRRLKKLNKKKKN